MAEYEAFFDGADANGNGFLTFEELKAALQNQGYTDDGVQAMFSGVDLSGDGKIEKNEFLEAMGAQPPTQHKDAAMRKMFKGFDTDGNGTISGEDLKKVWEEEFGRILTDDEKAKLLDRIEGAGGDDRIDYEEFLAYFRNEDRI